MDIYKSHDNVDCEEDSIPSQMERETLNPGRQLKTDFNYKQWKTVQYKKTAVATCKKFQKQKIPMKEIFL